jgi:hypothetical protein
MGAEALFESIPERDRTMQKRCADSLLVVHVDLEGQSRRLGTNLRLDRGLSFWLGVLRARPEKQTLISLYAFTSR